LKPHIIFVALVLSFLVLSCSQPPTEDNKFERLANGYVERLLGMNPEWATTLGDHSFDHRLGDYSIAGVERQRSLHATYLDSLRALDMNRLSTTNAIDYEILCTQLESMIFQIDTLKEYEWNPLAYNMGYAIYALVARDFAPLKDRLMSVEDRLKALPLALEQAKENLKNPPEIYTETAIQQNKGNINLVRDELKSFLDQVPELRSEFAPVQAQAVAALEAYGTYLEKELLPRSTGEFRLGDEKFRRKLRYTLESDLTKEEILRRAEEDLKATQNDIYQSALPLFQEYFPNVRDPRKLKDRKYVVKTVLAKLAHSRPTNESIVDLARKDLQDCTDFVRSNDLVTVPSEPVKVVVMPEFQRGVAVAYCDASGPLEKHGETFFAISPTPADWTSEQTVSFFKEYNDYMLQDLTIHEAMPGHYLQLAHASKFKAPTMVRAIFSSGTFVEGWATYAEQLMVQNGYGGPEVKMEQLKMRLRLIINAIIDQKIHTEAMTEKGAVDLMMNEGYQEKAEAEGKWRRAILTSTQLSTYFVGNLEINDIRNAYKMKFGTILDVEGFHDRILSFGSPAPKYVKKLMDL
jgi:uncharacterized protein (DUF885 family)